MALCSAPLVAAETETETDKDNTEFSFPVAVDCIPGSIVLDDDSVPPAFKSFELASDANTCERANSATESRCSTP